MNTKIDSFCSMSVRNIWRSMF